MSPTAALPSTATRRSRRLPFEWWWLFVAALAIALFIPVASTLHTGTFVDHVRIANPSKFDVEVDVTTAANDGWMGLGTAINRNTTVFDEVYDQGAIWIFRYRALDQHTEVRMTRADLERAGWTVRIPDDFAARLRPFTLQ
jgi:hypothetical protein